MRFISFLFLAGLSGVAFAKDLTCFEQKRSQDVSGWIPIEFRIVVSEDLQTAEIKSPILEQFGQDPFEKGFFGSDLWARGKGRSKSGDFYNYQLQLRFEDNYEHYKIAMKQHGYRDLTVTGECELTRNLYSGTQPLVESKDDGRSKETWSTPSKPSNDDISLDGVITFLSPNSATFININLQDGYYEHSSKNPKFKQVFSNALKSSTGDYIFYLGDADFSPFESAWRQGKVTAFKRNGREIIRVSDPSIKNFAWHENGQHLRFYVRVGDSWIGKELSGMGENRLKLNQLVQLSDSFSANHHNSEPLEEYSQSDSQKTLDSMTTRITRNWIRPNQMSESKSVSLTITILENGELDSVEVARTSGSTEFDNSALKAVHRASPFYEVKKHNSATFEKKFRTLTVRMAPEY